jgi:hypothetical protein
MAESDKTVATRRRHATIVDVAETAGVAVGTVSRYLNGQPIRNANRIPIEEAIPSATSMPRCMNRWRGASASRVVP